MSSLDKNLSIDRRNGGHKDRRKSKDPRLGSLKTDRRGSKERRRFRPEASLDYLNADKVSS